MTLLMEVPSNKPVGNGIQAIVPEGYHTRTEAARLTERDRDTLRRWHKTGTFPATHFVQAGKLKVWLYSDEDIEKLRNIAAEMKIGRPKGAVVA